MKKIIDELIIKQHFGACCTGKNGGGEKLAILDALEKFRTIIKTGRREKLSKEIQRVQPRRVSQVSSVVPVEDYVKRHTGCHE